MSFENVGREIVEEALKTAMRKARQKDSYEPWEVRIVRKLMSMYDIDEAQIEYALEWIKEHE